MFSITDNYSTHSDNVWLVLLIYKGGEYLQATYNFTKTKIPYMYMYVSLFRVRTEWYRILRKGSIFYLDKTLPTRLKCLKIQKGCVVCIICRFHKIEQCFNYINAKFQVVEFHYRSLFPRFRPIIFTQTFTGPGDLVVSCL